MFSRALKNSAGICQQRQRINAALRSFASRSSGLSEDRTKKVIEEIKKLEYELESRTKKKAASLDKIDEQDIAAIYQELAAPVPTRPKISSDYLENLRVKFLDTRNHQLENNSTAPQLITSSTTEAAADTLATLDKQTLTAEFSVKDFEQLIYANALAKRATEAEQAFNLMEKYNLTPSVRSFNHLMDAYANINDLEHAIATFKRMNHFNLTPDIYSYGSLIKAFVANKRLDDAFIVFDKMKESTLIPSQPIFANLISGCLKANDVEKAWEVFDAMRLSYHQPDEVSFTLMLHACAKRGEVERALNLFEDMAGYQLYPTDVTFNVLINACAKRPDYYNEAFSLLEQMQESYGFQPDKITYNTLLTACARKRDLGQARRIFNAMWKDVQTNGMEHSLLVPDSQTYTNLFWCYASSLNTKEKSASSTSSTSTDLTAKQDLLPSPVPTSRSAVVKEARWLFDQAEVQITSALLNAYLTLHITKQQSTSTCVDIYSQLFDKYQVKKDAFTFQHMLQLCYNSKDAKLAWKVWEDYQDYLEERRIQFVLPENNDIAAQKAVESERHALAIKEGWTNTHQQKMVILMSNTLARSNDLKNAIGILSSELRRSSSLNPPRLRDMMPAYNKCIQLEDQEAKKQLVYLCVKDQKRLGNSKYKRVNRTD